MKTISKISLFVYLIFFENINLNAQIADSLLQFHPIYGNCTLCIPFSQTNHPDSVFRITIENQNKIDISVYRNVQWLAFINDSNFKSLPNLSKCKKITRLGIYNTSGSEINVSNFPNLKKLSCDFIGSWVEKLENLEEINISRLKNEVDLSKLKKLKKIELIILDNESLILPIAPQIKSLKIIKYGSFKNLIQKNNLENISKYYNLESLDLSESENIYPISFYDAISKLKKLKKISLPTNNIHEFSQGLNNSQSITHVDLGYYESETCSTFFIPNLEILETSLDNYSIYNFKIFPKLKKLIVYLGLEHNPHTNFLNEIKDVPEVEISISDNYESMIYDTLFMSKLSKMKNIKTLEFYELSDQLNNMQFPFIEKLIFKGDYFKHNVLIDSFLIKFPNLKSIEIRICKYLKKFEIKDFEPLNRLDEVVLINDYDPTKATEILKIIYLIEKNCPKLKIKVREYLWER